MIDVHAHDILGYIGLTVLIAGMPLTPPFCQRLSWPARLVLAIASLAALWLVWFEGKPMLFYLRGLIGDLSLTTVTLILLRYVRFFGWTSRWTLPLSRDLGLLLVVTLTALYLSTLGYWQADLYTWGYRPRGMLIAMALLLAYAWWRQSGLALAWLVGLGGYACGLSPSANLWDALGDPLLCLAGLLRVFFPGRGVSAEADSARETVMLRFRQPKLTSRSA